MKRPRRGDSNADKTDCRDATIPNTINLETSGRCEAVEGIALAREEILACRLDRWRIYRLLA